MSRTCSKCSEEKPSDAFEACRSMCKKCRNRQIVDRRKQRFQEDAEAHAEHLEKNKLALREAREEEPERFRGYAQKYLSTENGRQKHNESGRRWRKTPKGREYTNAFCRERYAKDPKYYTQKRLAQRYEVPKGLFKEVWDRDGGCCVLCSSTDRLEYDHIHPVHAGGIVETADDLQLLCKPCNLFKSNNLFLPGGGMMVVSH